MSKHFLFECKYLKKSMRLSIVNVVLLILSAKFNSKDAIKGVFYFLPHAGRSVVWQKGRLIY